MRRQDYVGRRRRGAARTAPKPLRRFPIRHRTRHRPRAACTATAALLALGAGAASHAATAQAAAIDVDSIAIVDPVETRGAEIVAYAKRFRGTPYAWGGASPAGFDCSGLTSYVYARFGVTMAHYSGDQYAAYPKVARPDLAPGDLVFFAGRGHVGIYVGRSRFIHATHSGDVVRISSMRESWYRDGYVGASRPSPSTTGPSTT